MQLDLDPNRLTSEPMYRSIANQLLALISSGELPIGYQLPTSRELARVLGVSRDVVIQSYAELQSGGVIEVRSTKGTFVGGRNVPRATKSIAKYTDEPAGFLSEYCKGLTEESNLHASSGHASALNFGAAPANLLPNRAWHQLLVKHSKVNTHMVYKPDVLGRIELRKAIQLFLRKTKGIECMVEQIVIWSQSQNAFNSLCRILLNPGDSIVVENPGFGGIRDICIAQAAKLLPVPVDGQGLRTELLEDAGRGARLAYVTPTHQDPTGVVLEKHRRYELLQWADRHKVWIFEDDYDGLFNFDALQNQPLFSLDRSARVIYLSSFWKCMYPLTPVGFAVIPKSLVDVVTTSKLLSEPNAYVLEHLALAEYLMSGKFSNHVKRVQKAYAERRRSLVHQLSRNFGDTISVSRQSAGSHQLVNMGSRFRDDDVLKCGLLAGLGIKSTREYYLGEHQPGDFIIDFSCLSSEDCESVIAKFHELLRAH